MNLLCVLDKLPAADARDANAVNKKGGLFPVALHALVTSGHEVTLAVIDRSNVANERLLADQIGCHYLDEGRSPGLLRWWRVGRALRYGTLADPLQSSAKRWRKRWRSARERWERIRGAARIEADLWALDARTREFDHVIGLSSYDDAGLLADRLAGGLGCPFSVWEHKTNYARNALTPERIRKTRAAARRAHVTCTVSPQLREEIARTLGSDIRLDVIPNPIGDDFLQPPAAAPVDIDSIREGGFLFAAWTAWRDFKRLDVALDAFARVVADGRDAHFLVAGKPPDAARRQAESLGIADRVTFLGNVSRERIKAIAYACDCVVVPSDCETFGLPVIEGMAAGNPVVATRCGGPESIIVDERLGFIVERGDVEALSGRMRRVMDHRGDYDDGFIREWCREHYGETAFAKRWQAVLEAPGAD